MNKQILSICFSAIALHFASASTWEPGTHECSLTFPDTGWTLQEGAEVPNGHMLLTALNRDHSKSVNLLSVRGTHSGSVQDPGFSANFKRGFAAAGSRVINDGFTNLNGHIAYWLTGEKTNILGQQASTLSYSMFEGRALYHIHVESLSTVPFADGELLKILASFQVRAEPSSWRRFPLPGNSIVFCVGIIIGAVIVFRSLNSIRLSKRPRTPNEHSHAGS